MDLYGKQEKSIPQKTLIHLLELFLLWLSFWVLFLNGGEWLEQHLNIHNATENTDRRIVLFSFSVITFFRFSYMMIVLLKRKIPWEESFTVPFAFAIYFVGFSVLALPTSKAIDGIDFLGIALFILGSWLNTGGEILRNKWKKKPENKGKIYTEGYFRYSRHINYFGDLLWVGAYAILTRNWFSACIPLLLFFFFAFFNAPKLDKYLSDKYGEDYEKYARKTKMLIPFLY